MVEKMILYMGLSRPRPLIKETCQVEADSPVDCRHGKFRGNLDNACKEIFLKQLSGGCKLARQFLATYNFFGNGMFKVHGTDQLTVIFNNHHPRNRRIFCVWLTISQKNKNSSRNNKARLMVRIWSFRSQSLYRYVRMFFESDLFVRQSHDSMCDAIIPRTQIMITRIARLMTLRRWISMYVHMHTQIGMQTHKWGWIVDSGNDKVEIIISYLI